MNRLPYLNGMPHPLDQPAQTEYRKECDIYAEAARAHLRAERVGLLTRLRRTFRRA